MDSRSLLLHFHHLSDYYIYLGLLYSALPTTFTRGKLYKQTPPSQTDDPQCKNISSHLISSQKLGPLAGALSRTFDMNPLQLLAQN